MAQAKEDSATFNDGTKDRMWKFPVGSDPVEIRKILAETHPAIEKADLQIVDNGDGTRTLAFKSKAGDKG